LADAIKNRFEIEAELIKSGGGVFEVTHDDDLIFSKRELGRFPEEQEILDILAKTS
jgi:selenoprotein W-related protein